jgi:hypothetical protein
MCNINIFLTRKHEKQRIGYSSYGSYICGCTLEYCDDQKFQSHGLTSWPKIFVFK